MSVLQRGWHAATAVIVAVAVFGQFGYSQSQGRSGLNFFSYFTVQSNLLVWISAIALTVGVSQEARWFRLVRLAALTGITVTLLVFAVLIGPYVTLSGPDWWFDKGLHYVSPTLAILGFLVVGPTTRFRRADLAFIAWPAAWLAYTLGRAVWFSPAYELPDGSTAPVPYDFLDFDTLGAGRVAVTSVVITALLLALALGYIAFGIRRSRGSTDVTQDARDLPD